MIGVGITYNNTHSSTFNVRTILDHSIEGDLFVPSIDVITSENTYANGGNYHRTRYSTKTKKLSLFFENLEKSKLYKMISWISKTGISELIFDDIPFVTLDVFLSKEPDIKIYKSRDKVSGTIDLTLSIVEPFKRLNVKYLDDIASEYQELAKQMTRLISRNAYDRLGREKHSAPPNGSVVFYHNSGTAPMPLNIIINYIPEVEVKNDSNGNFLRALAAKNKNGENIRTSDINFDKRSERTYFVGAGNNITYAFEQHEGDYIELSPQSIQDHFVGRVMVENNSFLDPTDGGINAYNFTDWKVFINGTSTWANISSYDANTKKIKIAGNTVSNAMRDITLTKMDRIIINGEPDSITFQQDYGRLL